MTPAVRSRSLSGLRALVLVGLAVVGLEVLGCSSAPSYEGGPTADEPYAIVQPEDNCKMWAIDGKPAFSRLGETYASPGNHVFRFRIDYPIEDESQHPFEYVDYSLTVEAGKRYRVSVAGNYDKGPPYTLDHKVFKIRGYGN